MTLLSVFVFHFSCFYCGEVAYAAMVHIGGRWSVSVISSFDVGWEGNIDAPHYITCIKRQVRQLKSPFIRMSLDVTKLSATYLIVVGAV